MADTFPFPSSSPMPGTAEAHKETPADEPLVSAAVTKFKSCRWRRPPEDGPECCGHRDVLPMAGTTGFDPEAWCPDCTFYKLRRTPKKRSAEDYRY
ncbi:MAG TPA: hypothetical protein VHU82_02400 [Vicinamibacterales bacterium]|jgi:hypothetical protein|nr:hypothetical protein [Vicinamibacterales bacterium]